MSSAARASAQERLQSTVTENVRLALWLLFGLVVVLTPMVFLLAPENIIYNAVPRAATLSLLGASLWALPRRGRGEGAAFILLAVTAVTAMSLFEASLTQVPNHPAGLSPLLFFLGAMMIVPLQPRLCLLLGLVVVCAPWPFWWSGQITADPVFQMMYSASGVAMGIVGAASSLQRRRILLARFQAEEALTERGEHLREATEQLKSARDAARASDIAKSRFLSQVSHETRTPLTGILGLTELLQLRDFGELNERQASYVRQIRESGEHMLELIDDLLDVTRLDTDSVELDLEDVSPAEVVLEVVDNVARGSRAKKTSIVNEVGSDAPTLSVDRRRFRQSLYNLLSNALKFTPDGRAVGLRWSSESRGWLCIEVWDEGIGIAAEDLESIFEEFHQVDRKRAEVLGGSGIGLALTRRQVELHGGQVRVESTLGRGSSFFLVLPLAADPPGSAGESAAPMRRSKTPDWRALDPGPRVLVVEDNPTTVAVIRGLLEVRGIDPGVASNGHEAVAWVSRERPHLVLMDIHMPDCDGFEALAQIRADESLAAIPVVAMTASASESDQRRYLEAGFDAFLSKPIDSAKLDDQLKRFVLLEAKP
jgi:signal transduction histidine kinase/ActR/RegA family two-component response regulator